MNNSIFYLGQQGFSRIFDVRGVCHPDVASAALVLINLTQETWRFCQLMKYVFIFILRFTFQPQWKYDKNNKITMYFISPEPNSDVFKSRDWLLLSHN